MTKDKYSTQPESMRLSNEMEAKCRMVANKERCKHGMIFEYCGVCQRIETPKESKFPIDVKDRETGEVKLDANGKPRKIWIPVQTTRVTYMRYR